MSKDDIRFQLMKIVEAEPELSQRQLAERLGVSVGKTHYTLKALVEKGWVKVHNFQRSANKSAYFYQLTPKGITEKARLTRRFLARKRAEYEAIREEIKRLEAEVERLPDEN